MSPDPFPRYFTSSRTGALYRQLRGGDQVFRSGEGWVRTMTIARHMMGRDDDVQSVTEREASQGWPEAFAS